MKNDKCCICGCNTRINPENEFAPGHDGRVTGYFLRIHRGESMPEDFGPMVAQVWQKWNDMGQPGGELHPRFKDAARLARMGKSECI